VIFWDVVLGVVLALLVGYLIGYRFGVADGVRNFAKTLDELDVDKSFLSQAKAKWSASGQRFWK